MLGVPRHPILVMSLVDSGIVSMLRPSGSGARVPEKNPVDDSYFCSRYIRYMLFQQIKLV